MNSRDAQDLILRLLADGPFRAAALAPFQQAGQTNRVSPSPAIPGFPASANLPADVGTVLAGSAPLAPDAAAVLARVDRAGLDRFGRFLCRHYYRERVVHYFKYSRALQPLTGRAPEAALKTAEFTALMPKLVLGERRSAGLVLELLERHLTTDADALRAQVPYWDDLIRYQSVFFLSDAQAPEPAATPFPARAETARIVELGWDLPAVLPLLLRPFGELPQPPQRPTRLLFARSPHGEVTVLRCTDALRDLLESLTGQQDPAQVAARIGLDADAFAKTLQRLENLGAVVAQESFSASHVGSELPRGSCGG